MNLKKHFAILLGRSVEGNSREKSNEVRQRKVPERLL